jgi:hypothetical protein
MRCDKLHTQLVSLILPNSVDFITKHSTYNNEHTCAYTWFFIQKVKNKWWKCPTIKNIDYEEWLPVSKHKLPNEQVEYFDIGGLLMPMNEQKKSIFQWKVLEPQPQVFRTSCLVIRY